MEFLSRYINICCIIFIDTKNRNSIWLKKKRKYRSEKINKIDNVMYVLPNQPVIPEREDLIMW